MDDHLLDVLNSGLYAQRRRPLPPLRQRYDEEISALDPPAKPDAAEGVPQPLQSTQRNFFPDRTRAEVSALQERPQAGQPLEEKAEKLHKARTAQGGRRVFSIRKVSTQARPAAGRELVNLVPEITPDLNRRVDYRPNLAENRLAGSKHMLFKTFTRYLANPAQFQQQTAINELVDLNAGFTDAALTSKLFRGAATEKPTARYARLTSERSCFSGPSAATPKRRWRTQLSKASASRCRTETSRS